MAGVQASGWEGTPLGGNIKYYLNPEYFPDNAEGRHYKTILYEALLKLQEGSDALLDVTYILMNLILETGWIHNAKYNNLLIPYQPGAVVNLPLPPLNAPALLFIPVNAGQFTADLHSIPYIMCEFISFNYSDLID